MFSLFYYYVSSSKEWKKRSIINSQKLNYRIASCCVRCRGIRRVIWRSGKPAQRRIWQQDSLCFSSFSTKPIKAVILLWVSGSKFWPAANSCRIRRSAKISFTGSGNLFNSQLFALEFSASFSRTPADAFNIQIYANIDLCIKDDNPKLNNSPVI